MKIVAGLLVAAIAAWSSAAAAADSRRCDAPQQVSLLWNGAHVADWEASDGGIRTVPLPNGYRLGVRITPEDGDLVAISLHDMAHPAQRELTRTYGGENSLQGYGASGGADRVEELGDPGILLELSTAGCA